MILARKLQLQVSLLSLSRNAKPLWHMLSAIKLQLPVAVGAQVPRSASA